MPEIAEPKTVHLSIDGRRAQLESCQRRGEQVTVDPGLVTCQRCRVSLLRIGGEVARRGRAREGYLTTAQLRSVFQLSLSALDRAAIKTAYYIGLRATEIGLIHLDQLDTRRGVLDIQRLKGSIGGVYSIEPIRYDLAVWLRSRPASPWLFPHRRNAARPLDRRSFARIWENAARAAGLPEHHHHPHVLKHSIATHMLERGDDILHVQQWLGHKRTESTIVYAELSGAKKHDGQAIAHSLMKELE